MATCKNCGKELENDEIGIYKPMVHRGATEFLCIKCLAEYFKISEDLVREKIEHNIMATNVFGKGIRI